MNLKQLSLAERATLILGRVLNVGNKINSWGMAGDITEENMAEVRNDLDRILDLFEESSPEVGGRRDN